MDASPSWSLADGQDLIRRNVLQALDDAAGPAPLHGIEDLRGPVAVLVESAEGRPTRRARRAGVETGRGRGLHERPVPGAGEQAVRLEVRVLLELLDRVLSRRGRWEQVG